MPIDLYDYQRDAVDRMSNGCILCGGVGSGKSRTSLAYYFKEQGGRLDPPQTKMKDPQDLYIITTARKRDTKEWSGELITFLMHDDPELNYYKNKIVIDSWNNIEKYKNVEHAFFIFDEQRVVGKGVWVKSFLKIAKNNRWILLSATPGDTWLDYIPVFIANGFYRNRSEFYDEHVVFSRFSKYPKVDRYIATGRLIRLRNKILVDMDYCKKTHLNHIDIYTDYPVVDYKLIFKERWNLEKNKPIETASELCYELRKVVNSCPDRLDKLIDILYEKKRAIIFYNYDYELELIKQRLIIERITFSEWNGHKHQPIPDGNEWAYLVQYNAGAEGWNCIKTDTLIFYSQNYSYKAMVQASGRIDRLNTPYLELYYYHLKSRASIDIAISKALTDKKKFNEVKFIS